MAAIPYLLFWGLAIYAFLTPKKHIILYILFGCMSFGTFSIITPSLTGVTLTSAPLMAIIFFFRTFNYQGALDTIVDFSFSKKKLLLIFLFWVVALFITLTMPRFFEGIVDVVPMRGGGKYAGYAAPLEFTPQNITQLVYITISVFSVYTFLKVFQDEKMHQHALGALCLGATVIVITGYLDYLSQFSSAVATTLDLFRNANYAMLNEAEIFNSKRVVGLMAEASFFGIVTMSFLSSLYFLRKSIKSDFLRNKAVPALIFLLIILIYLSTSSGAYVGLAVFFVLAIFEWIWRSKMYLKNKLYKQGLAIEAFLLISLTVILLSLFLIIPSIFDPFIELIDTMVFKKTESFSYQERSAITLISWQSLFDSYGLGVGLGSTRASNSAIVLISSVGILGAILYYGFLLQTFLKKINIKNEYDHAILSGVKWSFIPPFVIDFLSATTPDFGLLNAFRFGLVIAISLSSVSQP